MAKKLTIATKKTGDKLTATEFNAVVDAVNENGEGIDAIKQSSTTMSQTVNAVQQKQNEQSTMIKTLQGSAVKMVVITQDDYDKLVADNKVDADTYYNILEE